MAAIARVLLLCAAWLIAPPALAQGFRAVADNAAILYDAPSTKARKLYIVNRGYPLEVVVVVEGWTKVRDAAGEFNWIESRQLTDRRTVMVRTQTVDVREAADDAAPIAFRARQNVILELVDTAPGGWLRVRHADGATGFLRTSQVWGA